MSANALPFLRWAGGKRWLAERVAERIQPRLESATYIEPFLGGGAMYFALAPKQRAILSDNNAELIETYQTLRASYALVAKELERLPVSAEDYYRIRDNERPRSRVGRAARFIYLNRTCYGGIHRTNQEGVFNVPYGGGDRNAKKILESGILETAARILRETRQLDLVARDFEFSISQARDGDVIYADPCYRGSARIGYDRYGPKAYSFEDQKRLAKCLLFAFEKNALILLSTQATEGFEELVARGFVLTLWRRPGLTHPGKQQTGKELLIVLDPKHDLARWEPLSDFNVKLNGKHSAVRYSAALVVQTIYGSNQEYRAILCAWRSYFSSCGKAAMRIPNSRSFDGICQSFNESLRLSPLYTFEQIFREGGSDHRRSFLG
jgi:DNA adenine methylase